MRAISRILVASAVVLALAGCPNIALKDFINKELGITATRVGSIADSRTGGLGWTLDGANMYYVRQKLLNPVNFGPNGTSKKSIVITDITGTIDAKVLERLDVLVIGYFPDGTLSAAELSAIESWVRSGGVAIVQAEDQTADAVAEKFGYPLDITDDYYGADFTVPTASGLPLFNGPFGNITDHIRADSSSGLFTTTAGLTVLGYDDARPIVAGNLPVGVAMGNYGSGKLILLGTIGFIDDTSLEMSWSSTIDTSYREDVFLGNLFAYVH